MHQDFHPGNILVRMEANDDHPRLAMIDLDALRVCHPLSWPEAQVNLALLNHYFWLRCGRSDRYRFFKTYLRDREISPPDPGAFARSIESATRALGRTALAAAGQALVEEQQVLRKLSGQHVLVDRLA